MNTDLSKSSDSLSDIHLTAITNEIYSDDVDVRIEAVQDVIAHLHRVGNFDIVEPKLITMMLEEENHFLRDMTIEALIEFFSKKGMDPVETLLNLIFHKDQDIKKRQAFDNLKYLKTLYPKEVAIKLLDVASEERADKFICLKYLDYLFDRFDIDDLELDEEVTTFYYMNYLKNDVDIRMHEQLYDSHLLNDLMITEKIFNFLEGKVRLSKDDERLVAKMLQKVARKLKREGDRREELMELILQMIELVPLYKSEEIVSWLRRLKFISEEEYKEIRKEIPMHNDATLRHLFLHCLTISENARH